MATITKTIAETSGNTSTWTLTVSANDIILNEEKTFYLPIPTVKAKYTAYGTKNGADVDSILYLDQSGMPPKSGSYYQPNYELGGGSTVVNRLAPNTFGNVAYVGNGETTTHSTSEYFNSSNPTQGAIPLNVMVAVLELASYYTDGSAAGNPLGSYSYNSIRRYDESLPHLEWGTVASIKLDVPPTYVASSLHIDTTAIYSDITTVSVVVSDLTAYYGGYIASAELKIGNQTATLTGDATNVLSSGTLSILLDTAGTFTPTVTITDSRGQTATRTYATITVNSYVAPALSMNLERVDANGDTDDEGAYGLITATISYTNAITKLLEPTVTIDGVATATTNWYTDRALTTLVDWSDYNPASPVTIYGHFGGSFSTQSSYLIGVTPIDTHTSGAEVTQTLATAFYTIDFRAGGHGIAFGQPSSQDGFFCNMSACFIGQSYLDLTDYATAGTDKDIYDALNTLGWTDCIVDL